MKTSIDFIYLFLQSIDYREGPQSPDEGSQSCDVNDGPDFFNRFQTPSQCQSTFAVHPAPVRKVKRQLF